MAAPGACGQQSCPENLVLLPRNCPFKGSGDGLQQAEGTAAPLGLGLGQSRACTKSLNPSAQPMEKLSQNLQGLCKQLGRSHLPS